MSEFMMEHPMMFTICFASLVFSIAAIAIEEVKK